MYVYSAGADVRKQTFALDYGQSTISASITACKKCFPSMRRNLE